jgi:DNA-binding response OmpR family regulator
MIMTARDEDEQRIEDRRRRRRRQAVQRARVRSLQQVWGYDALPTTRTVDTHVLNLRKKIEATPDRPQHLSTVHRVGYRLVL